MSNQFMISKKQTEALGETMNNFAKLSSKDYRSNYNREFSYKALDWADMDEMDIVNILNTESSINRGQAESERLSDFESKTKTVIFILDKIKDIVNEMQTKFLHKNSRDVMRSSQMLGVAAKNKLDQIITLCNTRSNNGDYVMSGSAVKTKPFDENSIEYKGSTSNLSLVSIGEINVRGDNKFIKNILDSFQRIALHDKSSWSNEEVYDLLNESFKGIIELKEETAILLSEINLLSKNNLLKNNDLLNQHAAKASQSDLEFFRKRSIYENSYQTTLGLIKKGEELFNKRNMY